MEKIGRGPCYGASVGDKTPAPGALLPQGTARDVPDAKGRTGATRKNCYCFCSPAGASVAAEAAPGGFFLHHLGGQAFRAGVEIVAARALRFTRQGQIDLGGLLRLSATAAASASICRSCGARTSPGGCFEAFASGQRFGGLTGLEQRPAS